MTQPRPGRLIAIASGKGGVGKTWLAITLAHALAQAERRVLLFDGDLGLANIDIQLGLMPHADLGGVLAGRFPLARAILTHEQGGFDILPGQSGSGGLAGLPAATLATLLTGLRAVAASYDIVILDLGAGIGRAVRQMAASADELLVVLTGEPTSLTDAYAVLKLHAADQGRAAPGIVVNQARSHLDGERIHATLSKACATFLGHAPKLSGVIRGDDHVREAIRRQALLLTRHPASPAAADVARLASFLLAGRPIHEGAGVSGTPLRFESR